MRDRGRKKELKIKWILIDFVNVVAHIFDEKKVCTNLKSYGEMV